MRKKFGNKKSGRLLPLAGVRFANVSTVYQIVDRVSSRLEITLKEKEQNIPANFAP